MPGAQKYRLSRNSSATRWVSVEAARNDRPERARPPSKLTEGDARGFRAATDEYKIDVVELISLLPLRDYFGIGILYLRGSVQFFQTYPGMYVPRPLELSVSRPEATLEQLAKEILSLSKLNWNNTQFDGGAPITVRAARRVGDILKCLSEGVNVQPSFRFYM